MNLLEEEGMIRELWKPWIVASPTAPWDEHERGRHVLYVVKVGAMIRSRQPSRRMSYGRLHLSVLSPNGITKRGRTRASC